MTPGDLASFVGFAIGGSLSVAQDLAARVIEGMEGCDRDLVAEETLALVGVASARAAEFALGEAGVAASATLMDLPFAYHDYLIGSALLQGLPEEEVDGQVYERLARIREFYAVHVPGGKYPGRRVLTDKMGLWMGRMSPPRLPEPPQARLERLGLVEIMSGHLKLLRVRAESAHGS